MQILRFKLPGEHNAVKMPSGSRVLHIAVKPGETFVSLWALCPHVDPIPSWNETRHFRVIGTGWKVELPESAIYLGTAMEVTAGFEPGRPQTFCWHVFEVLPVAEFRPREPAA